MAGLCPGFKHVEAFDDDEGYEEETEVSYVTIDLGNNVDKSLLPNTSAYRLIGLDTATPMLQISGLFFKGTHEDLLGTEMLFTDGRDDTNISRKFVVPVGTTERRIQFQPVEITAKEPQSSQEATRPRESRSKKRHTTARKQSSGKAKRRGQGSDPPVLHEYGEAVMELDSQK